MIKEVEHMNSKLHIYEVDFDFLIAGRYEPRSQYVIAHTAKEAHDIILGNYYRGAWARFPFHAKATRHDELVVSNPLHDIDEPGNVPKVALGLRKSVNA